ncbi:hypothetical protein HAX54_011436 [Datura stramonium]|uniref:Putative plant transposon protein domain-containing protein n=1 Tax=Datura stramonium TaxID=4076 RepID=A0ABS8TJJ3_DATST|nr:hypothetical protein [Datura stramonium]
MVLKDIGKKTDPESTNLVDDAEKEEKSIDSEMPTTITNKGKDMEGQKLFTHIPSPPPPFPQRLKKKAENGNYRYRRSRALQRDKFATLSELSMDLCDAHSKLHMELGDAKANQCSKLRDTDKGLHSELRDSRSVARWTLHQQHGYHMIFPYAYLSREAGMWLKFFCSCMILGKHATYITLERVYLVYVLMTGMSIKVGVILRNFLRRAMIVKRYRLSFGALLTQFLRALHIEEKATDYRLLHDSKGRCKKSKEPEDQHIMTLSIVEQNAQIDNVLSHLYGMQILQFRKSEVTKLSDRGLPCGSSICILGHLSNSKTVE